MTDPIPLVLKFDDWPKADCLAWEELFATGDLFDDIGPCRNWSEGSRTKRLQGYGQWLSFLARTDPDALNDAPANRVTEAQMHLFIDECQERLKPRSVANLVSDVFVLIRAMSPDENWEWLNIASRRLNNSAMKYSLPAPVGVTAHEAFQWSLMRMQEVEEDAALSVFRRATRFREALMIAFLLSRPLRRRALLSMQINTHIREAGDGFHLYFSGEEIKGGRARDFALPATLCPYMRRYLNVHRVVLLGDNTSQFLWLSQYGVAIKPHGFSRQLPKVTDQHLKVSLRPHAFRHIAATSIAEDDPEHVNIICDILGHTTLAMAQKHYNRATGIRACNAYQDITEKLRGRRK